MTTVKEQLDYLRGKRAEKEPVALDGLPRPLKIAERAIS